MFDQILQVLKDHATEALSSHPDVTPGTHDAAAGEAAGSIMETIQEKIGQGNFSEITDLLSGNHSPQESPITQAASSNLIEKLTTKLGVAPEQASSIASSVIPSILGKVVQKTNDPEGQQFDLKGMISQFAGGNFGGIDLKSILGSFGGKPKD